MPAIPNKLRLLIFHPALAPYRVDQFNQLNEIFNLHIVFCLNNISDNNFDQQQLLSQLTCSFSYVKKVLKFGHRFFPTGTFKLIKQHQPDIIIGYEFSLLTQFLLFAKRFGIIKQLIGTTNDDSLAICNNIQSIIRSVARKIAINRLDFLVVLSNQIATYYIENYHLQKNQLIVSPILQSAIRIRKNSDVIKMAAFEHQRRYGLEEKKVLLSVGRLVKEKNFVNYIRLIAPILKQQNVIYVIVGEGVEQKAIEAEIISAGLTNIILPGRFEGVALYAWYALASGFVLPSTYEPFGAVVDEALIFGLKVLCSKAAGASVLIKDNKGDVFDPENDLETLESTKIFISKMVGLSATDILDRPSLSLFSIDESKFEWSKLLNLNGVEHKLNIS